MSIIVENPRGACVLGGVNNVLNAIHKFVPIYHAGPGCAMQNQAAEGGQAGLRGPIYATGVTAPCTNMLENEVVFGGEDRLRDEIDGALEVMDADALFVLTGCTAGIIGDDIQRVAEEYRRQGHRVYPVITPGFAGNSLLGYEAIWAVFLDHIVRQSPAKRPELVNILGVVPYHDPHWQGTLEELTRILRRLGLAVNTFYTENQGFETLAHSSEAALNLIVSPYLLKDAGARYEAEFGVPSLRIPGLPVGAGDTSALIRRVAAALSLDDALTERVIREEEAYLYTILEASVGAISWKRFAVVAESAYAIGLTRFLANDLSLKPELTVVTEPIFRPSDRKNIESSIKTLDYADPPEVFFETDNYEIREILKANENITYLIGSSVEEEIAQQMKIQMLVGVYPLTDRLVLHKTYAGYRGALTLVEDLFNNL
jgi:nitrogenase molybdenum-iron protein beta chain